MENYYLYVLQCSDSSYYCGIAKNVEKRLCEHNHTKKASKYVRARKPAELVYTSSALNKNDALSYEKKFKKLNRKQKENLIASNINIQDFFN
jgi:putative endonuclease